MYVFLVCFGWPVDCSSTIIPKTLLFCARPSISVGALPIKGRILHQRSKFFACPLFIALRTSFFFDSGWSKQSSSCWFAGFMTTYALLGQDLPGVFPLAPKCLLLLIVITSKWLKYIFRPTTNCFWLRRDNITTFSQANKEGDTRQKTTNTSNAISRETKRGAMGCDRPI